MYWRVSRMRSWADRPNTLPWPPIVYGCAAALAFGLGRFFPIATSFLPHAIARDVGIVVMFVGIGLDFAAMITMRRARANILPHRAATGLVTNGPFSLSRNPIYLGNTLLLGGAGLAFGNAWFLIAAAIAVQLVTVLAIRREEAHLASRFGPAWDAYARRTPRWLGLRRHVNLR